MITVIFLDILKFMEEKSLFANIYAYFILCIKNLLQVEFLVIVYQ
jgi:hypothetical protein